MFADFQLALTIEVVDPSGVTTHWHAGHKDPMFRPRRLSFSTARYDGFKTLSLELPRRADRDYPDLTLGSIVRVIGGSGDIVWEGRLAATPRGVQETHSYGVDAVGLMANARDTKFQMIFVDRDMSHWSGPPIPRRADLLTAGRMMDLEFQGDESGQVVTFPATAIGNPRQVSELWYVAPENMKLGAIYYKSAATGTFTSWTRDFYTALNILGSNSVNQGNDIDDGALHNIVPAAPERVIFYQLDSLGNSVTPTTGQHRRFSQLAVYGDHGLSGRDTGTGEPPGFYPSDVIRWLIDNHCPQLNARGVQTADFAIPHLVFTDRTHPYDAMLVANSFTRWGLECWEGGTVHYGPVDYTDYDWQLRMSDFGASMDDQGPSLADSANGIVVTFTDANDGTQRILLPRDYPELQDNDPANPWNRAGLVHEEELAISSVATQSMALRLGRIALLEFNQPKGPGSVTKRVSITDRAGHEQPVWKVRAGHRVLIADHPTERVLLVQETSYDHESLTATISFDGPPATLEAYLDRYANALQAANVA